MKKILPVLFLLLPIVSYAGGAQDRMLKMALDSLNYTEAAYWLDHGADPNGYVDDHFMLWYAMTADFHRHMGWGKNLPFSNGVPFTSLLLSKGANANNNIGLLPLTTAVIYCDYRLCHILLEYGADPYKVDTAPQVNVNAIDYAGRLGYTRVADYLASPHIYSEQPTIFELDYLLKEAFANREYEKEVEYVELALKNRDAELSPAYDGWLTREHLQFYLVSGLVNIALQKKNIGAYDEAEALLVRAAKVDAERREKPNAPETGFGHIEYILMRVRREKTASARLSNTQRYVASDDASVLDDLAFLIAHNRQDATMFECLLSCASFYRGISESTNGYNCYVAAHQLLQEQPTLWKQLSQDTKLKYYLYVVGSYSKGAPPILSDNEVEQAWQFFRDNYGTSSLEYQSFQESLGFMYLYAGNVPKCKSLMQNVVRFYETEFSENIPDTNFTALYVLAKTCLYGVHDVNDNNPLLAYKELKSLMSDPKYKEYIGIQHYRDWISLCYHLRYDEMWSVIADYYEQNHTQISYALSVLSLEEQTKWLHMSYCFFYDSYVVRATNHSSNITGKEIGEIYNNELFKKGLLLRSVQNIKSYIDTSYDPVAIQLYETIVEQKKQLLDNISQKSLSDPTVRELQKSVDSKERLLSTLSAEYKAQNDYSSIGWQDIQQKLKDNEVAIEFCNYGYVDQYYALIIRSQWKYPKIVLLPDFLLIPNRDEEFRTQVEFWEKYGKPHGMPKPKFMAVKGNASELYEYEQNGTYLYNAIWKPLKQYVNDGDVVFLSPSGVLYDLAIEALPVDEHSVLADKYKIVRLSSTRELVMHKDDASWKHKYGQATIYGGIQYDVDTAEMLAESRNYAPNAMSAMRSMQNDTTNRGTVKYLAGTKKEADIIAKLLSRRKVSTTLYTSVSANEESFKSLSGKHQNIIHIGTHGFCWTDSEAHGKDYFKQQKSQSDAERYTIEPLNRCGLLFAGANLALSGHSNAIPAGVEDGILTAKEISLMDLRDCELVVLSACETAKGDITSDGVFGLQRAFKMAGAQTIIMSLWAVNDNATQMLMTEFYTNWVENKQSKREAFRNAQDAVRYAVDKDGDRMYENPVYWAGFIMLD